ncbi:RNA polymerase sigma factor [Sphingobium rhizovicinum]|uniref:RNA polymerase sigma factor n=1 Tax=Sphingobium rhizovicinum TaxID=432308 RepID=A0ABV7NJZ8_9SPHN
MTTMDAEPEADHNIPLWRLRIILIRGMGDPVKGLSDFYQRQHRGLVRYARAVSSDEFGAEDLVQEAWIRCRTIENRESIVDPGHLFRRVLRNLAIDRSRSLARERARSQGGDPDSLHWQAADDRPSAERVVIARSELHILRDALAALDDRTRVAFEMHRFEGARLEDIAAALDISVTRAHELVAAALRHCRTALRQYPDARR